MTSVKEITYETVFRVRCHGSIKKTIYGNYNQQPNNDLVRLGSIDNHFSFMVTL